MWRESYQPVREHVRILAVLNIVMGSLGLLLGICFLLFFGGLGVFASLAGKSDPDAFMAIPVMGAVGGIVFVALFVFAAPQIIGGIGLLKGQGWARILMIVFSALGLLSVPIGTAMGIYGLWVLLNDETARMFAAPEPVS